MAIVSLFQPTNMNAIYTWPGDVLIANATTIRISDGYRIQDYYGSFTYDQFDNVFGTLTGSAYWEGGVLQYTLSGASGDANYVYTQVEIIGDAQAALAHVLSGADILYGTQLNDELVGYGGNDIMFGFAGNDRLSGHGGSNWLEGGEGNDVLDINGPSLGTSVLLGGPGDDFITAGASTSAFPVIAIGGSGSDQIIGGPGNDWVEGGFFDSENDTVYGGAGNDTVVGGGGFDTLYGEAGDDLLAQADGRGMLYGGEGNDWLYGAMGYDAGTGEGDTLGGGKGADNLVGFGGNDYFVFNKADLAAGVLDTIHGFGDFSGGAFGPDQDVIRFTGGIVLGDLSYVDAGTGVTINVDLGAGQHAEIFVWGMQQASIADDITFI